MFVCLNAESVTYSGANTVDSFDEGDIIIENDAVITTENSQNILINGGVHLYNAGYINGNVDTNGFNLFVYNSGYIDNIVNTNGGHITQVIRSGSEMTDINIIGNQSHDVIIYGYDNFNFDNIHNMNVESLTIQDSSVVIDDFSDWQMCNENITLGDNVLLIINNANTVTPGEVIAFTKRGSIISVQITDLDKLYKPELVVANGGIVLNIVRETNYNVIFGSVRRSAALELIRQKNPNDRLLRALDSANDIATINRLQRLSYRFSHDILLRPMKMMNKLYLSRIMQSEINSGIGIVPYYVMSDKMESVGGRIYAGYNYENIALDIGLNIGKFDYSDELNEFSGMAYGLDIKSKQTFGKFWLSDGLGFSFSDMKADYISKEGDIKNNPLGFSLYGDISTGYNFDVTKNIVVSPVVGVSYQSYRVADVSDTDLYVHGGANVNYVFVMDGLKYEYSVSGAYGTNNDLFADIKIGFLSINDNAGVSVGVGVIKDDFDYYYRFLLNGKISF
jgi:hypothetical protein